MNNQLLSDEEIAKLQAKHTEHVCSMDQPPMSVLHIKSFVADVIAAHTAKLLEGVALPEPDFALDGGQRHCYYADTVAAALSAARAELSARDAEIAGLRARIAAELQDAVGCGNQYEANLCMRLIGAMSGQAGEVGNG